MMRLPSVYALLAVAAVVTASAEDFPLTFRTIPAQDLRSFPNGAGSSALMSSEKPATLRQEPKAMSRHPLYGAGGSVRTGGSFVFRLDESKGDGKGYDQLIVDMNRNGDLTDDPVTENIIWPSDRGEVQHGGRLFGPIQVPADRSVAGGRPVYFAQVYFLNRQNLSSGRRTPNTLSAHLMFKAGWYLDTTVKVDGLEQKVGVIDADANLRLGDVSQPQTRTNRGEKSWFFWSGDFLLVDADGSGRFDSELFLREVRPFSPILYLGSKAYQVALTADYKSLRVEPWPEPLAEVALQPRGEQVRNISLAWECPNGQWQRILPAVTNGKVMVPSGSYRLLACDLLGRRAPGDQVVVLGIQSIPQTPMTFAAGKANTLGCGGPLQIKVTATKTSAPGRGILSRYFGAAWAGSDPLLNINATVAGAGGEVYSTFLTGERLNSWPPKPTFSIVQAGGRTVASGNLEYG